jgi:hypothetical protein
MTKERVEQMSSLLDAIKDLNMIIEDYEKDDVTYKPYFSYHKRPVITFSLDVRIDKSLNDDLIAVIKRHKEKLEKEFEEL